MTKRVVLVVAKAPEPGKVKTRLMSQVDANEAAALAAAALIDTMTVAKQVSDAHVVVALSGNMDNAINSRQIRELLADTTLIPQHGDDLGQRLHRAHCDAAQAVGEGARVMQVGMDTPQITVELLEDGLASLDNDDCALGMANDGGWWALALRDAGGADRLVNVPMSRADTGALTCASLVGAGYTVAALPILSDVDYPDDIAAVARLCAPHSAFAAQARRWVLA